MGRQAAHAKRGFSLIELVVVVVILAALATIAVPRAAHAASRARHTAFVSHLRALVHAAEVHLQTADAPFIDSHSAEMPTEFEGVFDEEDWENDSPIGGEWDLESNDVGVGLAIGINNFDGAAEIADLVAVDRLIDDGRLTSGNFREIYKDRYFWVVREQPVR
ncbi:MAG: prepilin-type N-terminal cleavage/methylation domain-containing protein [Planctomycetota bacterium]